MGAEDDEDTEAMSEVLEGGLADERQRTMSELIKHTYRDVEIIYVEREDHWNFTVNGRERNLESLAKAKESIDRSLDYERKERPWKPFEAYLQRYSSDDFEKVTITSQAESSRYSGSQSFWVSKNRNGKKERSKESQHDLYAATAENEQKIARWRELDKEIDARTLEQRTLKEAMESVRAPEAAESAS